MKNNSSAQNNIKFAASEQNIYVEYYGKNPNHVTASHLFCVCIYKDEARKLTNQLNKLSLKQREKLAL